MPHPRGCSAPSPQPKQKQSGLEIQTIPRAISKSTFALADASSTPAGLPGGPVFTYEAFYQDIVPNERIVTTYAMQKDGTPISASVTTMELAPEGSGTRLTLTEQGAYLDAIDTPEIREGGMRDLLDSLASYLQRESATVKS